MFAQPAHWMVFKWLHMLLTLVVMRRHSMNEARNPHALRENRMSQQIHCDCARSALVDHPSRYT